MCSSIMCLDIAHTHFVFSAAEVVLGVFLALALVALLSLCVALVLTLLARRRTVKNKRLNALVNTTEESEDEIL